MSRDTICMFHNTVGSGAHNSLYNYEESTANITKVMNKTIK